MQLSNATLLIVAFDIVLACCDSVNKIA